MPISGVRSQLLPLHGELSTRSFAPAASTSVWLASMASAGSLTPSGRYGVGGPATDTFASVTVIAPALAGNAHITASNRNAPDNRNRLRRISLPPAEKPQ